MSDDPWKRKAPKNPKPKLKLKLTPEQIALARSLAAKAGRRYPNLIDNMRVARMVRETGKKD